MFHTEILSSVICLPNNDDYPPATLVFKLLSYLPRIGAFHKEHASRGEESWTTVCCESAGKSENPWIISFTRQKISGAKVYKHSHVCLEAITKEVEISHP